MVELLEKLRDWWDRHGSRVYDSADDWINSLSNVELLETLSWFEEPD